MLKEYRIILERVPVNLFRTDDKWKFLVMIGTLLYVSGSCERHSELTEEMYMTLRLMPKEDSSSLMSP